MFTLLPVGLNALGLMESLTLYFLASTNDRNRHKLPFALHKNCCRFLWAHVPCLFLFNSSSSVPYPFYGIRRLSIQFSLLLLLLCIASQMRAHKKYYEKYKCDKQSHNMHTNAINCARCYYFKIRRLNFLV